MKEFKMTHLFFENSIEFFAEDKPPSYMVSKDFKWWYDDYVLKLEVGQHIDTDFRRVERIK